MRISSGSITKITIAASRSQNRERRRHERWSHAALSRIPNGIVSSDNAISTTSPIAGNYYRGGASSIVRRCQRRTPRNDPARGARYPSRSTGSTMRLGCGPPQAIVFLATLGSACADTRPNWLRLRANHG